MHLEEIVSISDLRLKIVTVSDLRFLTCTNLEVCLKLMNHHGWTEIY